MQAHLAALLDLAIAEGRRIERLDKHKTSDPKIPKTPYDYGYEQGFADARAVASYGSHEKGGGT